MSIEEFEGYDTISEAVQELHKKYFSNIHQFSSTYQVERMIEL
jgi:hypothetical protein